MNSRRSLSFLLAYLLLFLPIKADAQLVINELMQSNVDCIMDDLNDFPDSWVELYNAGDTIVDLKDYGLSVSSSRDSVWSLPSLQIRPSAHVLVYCDKVGLGLHTNFRLESGKGGSVYLFHHRTITDQVLELPKQPAPNVAYGRERDGSDVWGYQKEPSPEAPNTGELCESVLKAPVALTPGGVYHLGSELYVELAIPEGSPADAVIHYTTDGREPTIYDPVFYYGTVIVSNESVVLRSKVFCDGYLPSPSITESYIILDREQTLPVVSLVTDDNYIHDGTIGILSDALAKDGLPNYQHDWRRPVNIEFFETDKQEAVVNQLCEMRVGGQASRTFPLRSLIVYANKRFGKKRLKHEFFHEDKPGITTFKSLMLRNAGNDFKSLYMRDAIIQRSMGLHADLDWQAWQPTIVYLNGKYLGMLNMRERSNEDNVFSNHDGLEDIDLFEGWGNLKEGDRQQYYKFRSFYSEPGHTVEEYERMMDWGEFLNLMILNAFYNNQDFPGGNIVLWRPRIADGRWRFIAKDTDYGLGANEHDPLFTTIDWLYNPSKYDNRSWANIESATLLFRNMMMNDDLRREFIDRAAIYMGDFLSERAIREMWDSMVELVEKELELHRMKYPGLKMSTELRRARNWLSQRVDAFYQQLSDFYELGDTVRIKMGQQSSDDELSAVDFFMNGIPLSIKRFDGKYFVGRELTINSVPRQMKVERWEVSIEDHDGYVSEDLYYGSSITLNVPSCKSITIEPRFDYYDAVHPTRNDVHYRRIGSHLILDSVPLGQQISLFDSSGLLLYQGVSQGNSISIQLSSAHFFLLRVGDKTRKICL